MTDQDRPTTPGTIQAAASNKEVHDRDTLPASLPAAIHAPASGSAPTPGVPAQASAADDAAIEFLRDSEIKRCPPAPPPEAIAASLSSTRASLAPVRSSVAPRELWYDPLLSPPPGDLAAPATATGEPLVDAASSIAPREVSRRPFPAPRSNRASTALLAVAMLAGAAAIVLYRARNAPSTSSDEGAARASAASPAMPAQRRDPMPSAMELPVPTPAPALPAAVSSSAAIVGSLPSGDRAALPNALPANAQRTFVSQGPVVRRRVAAQRGVGVVPQADLPETPSRDSIASSLNALRGAIEQCTAGRKGVAEVDLTIHGSGAVAHAVVGGDFAGTSQGSCIARTLRIASFGRFQKPKFRVLYKLML
jgi:hypothetical protein